MQNTTYASYRSGLHKHLSRTSKHVVSTPHDTTVYVLTSSSLGSSKDRIYRGIQLPEGIVVGDPSKRDPRALL